MQSKSHQVVHQVILRSDAFEDFTHKFALLLFGYLAETWAKAEQKLPQDSTVFHLSSWNTNDLATRTRCHSRDGHFSCILNRAEWCNHCIGQFLSPITFPTQTLKMSPSCSFSVQRQQAHRSQLLTRDLLLMSFGLWRHRFYFSMRKIQETDEKDVIFVIVEQHTDRSHDHAWKWGELTEGGAVWWESRSMTTRGTPSSSQAAVALLR